MEAPETIVSSVGADARVVVRVPDSESRAEVLWRAAARLCREAGELEAEAQAGSSPASREAFVAARYAMLQSRGDVVTDPDIEQAVEVCVGCGSEYAFLSRGDDAFCADCAQAERATA